MGSHVGTQVSADLARWGHWGAAGCESRRLSLRVAKSYAFGRRGTRQVRFRTVAKKRTRSKIHQGSGAEMSSRIWRSERHAKRLRNGLRILCHYAVMTCDTPGWQARNNSDIGTGLATTLTSSVWLRVPNICFMRVRFSSHTRPIPNTHGAWLVASPSQTPCDTSFISSKKHV